MPRKQRAPRTCPHCEQSFIPTQARQRFCSLACGAHASKYREANRETSDAWFTPEVRRVVGILTQQWPHQGQPYAGPY